MTQLLNSTHGIEDSKYGGVSSIAAGFVCRIQPSVQLLRAVGIIGIVTVAMAGRAHAAEGFEFPWGCADCSPTMPPPRAAYRTLPAGATAAARPIAEMPAKVPYAYGWYGSNPTLHWSRQFGWTRGYTQWSRK